jgi:hypothetical protein
MKVVEFVVVIRLYSTEGSSKEKRFKYVSVMPAAHWIDFN